MMTAKLFRNGRSQAVRLPKEFRFMGKEVCIQRFGDGVLLLPEEHGFDAMFDAADQFPPDFMRHREQLPIQERPPLFP